MRHAHRLPTLAVLIVSILAIACSRAAPAPPTKSATKQSPNPDIPVLVVTRNPGMSMSNGKHGVTLAVWADGIAIACTDPMDPTTSMVVGHVDPAALEAAMNELESAGFFDHPRQAHYPPDAQNFWVIAHRDTRTGSHGVMALDGTYPQWWPRCGAAVSSIILTDTRPIGEVATDGAFRGYVIDRWCETPWRR